MSFLYEFTQLVTGSLEFPLALPQLGTVLILGSHYVTSVLQH